MAKHFRVYVFVSEIKNEAIRLFQRLVANIGDDNTDHEERVDTRVALSDTLRVTDKRLRDPFWQRAWLLTEKIFIQFAEEVRRDGAQFMIASLPTEPIDKDVPPDYLTQADLRIGKIAEHTEVWYLPLTHCFRKYL